MESGASRGNGKQTLFHTEKGEFIVLVCSFQRRTSAIQNSCPWDLVFEVLTRTILNGQLPTQPGELIRSSETGLPGPELSAESSRKL